MMLKPGLFLSSTENMDDPNFGQALIFLTEYNAQGAMGFVINKPFSRSLNELEEFRHSKPFRLYDGGPADREHLFFIHRRPDLIEGGELIKNAVYLGGDFKQAVNYINNKTITEADIKLFIGYCGWDPRQLEEEIKEGSWALTEQPEQTIFS